jgi:hypothetical protein
MPKDFQPKEVKGGEFKPLLPTKNKKKVNIKGEFDFSSTSLLKQKETDPKETIIEAKSSGKTAKRGRPVTITDKRNKVSVPKKISPALNSKLSVLEDYMTEFQSETGRITFEKIVDTLAEAYITQKLSVAKEEHIREEIGQKFDDLKK